MGMMSTAPLSKPEISKWQNISPGDFLIKFFYKSIETKIILINKLKYLYTLIKICINIFYEIIKFFNKNAFDRPWTPVHSWEVDKK